MYSLSAKSTPALSYPIAPFLNGPGTASANADYRDRKDMYVSEWGLSVQQALPHDLVGTLSYVGSKGTYELITSYVNLINPATGLRPYPAFGQVQWRGNSNSSSYDGLVASLQRSFTPWPADLRQLCVHSPDRPGRTRRRRLRQPAKPRLHGLRARLRRLRRAPCRQCQRRL